MKTFFIEEIRKDRRGVNTYHSLYRCNKYQKAMNKFFLLTKNYPELTLLFSVSYPEEDMAFDIIIYN